MILPAATEAFPTTATTPERPDGIWVGNILAFNGDLVRELAAQFLALAEKQVVVYGRDRQKPSACSSAISSAVRSARSTSSAEDPRFFKNTPRSRWISGANCPLAGP